MFLFQEVMIRKWTHTELTATCLSPEDTDAPSAAKFPIPEMLHLHTLPVTDKKEGKSKSPKFVVWKVQNRSTYKVKNWEMAFEFTLMASGRILTSKFQPHNASLSSYWPLQYSYIGKKWIHGL